MTEYSENLLNAFPETGRLNMWKRACYFLLNVTRGIYWHPHGNQNITVRKQEWANECLRKQIQMLQQIAYLQKARLDFTNMQDNVLNDRKILANDMDNILNELHEKRKEFNEAKSNNDPVEIIKSDTVLLLCNYERHKKLYMLHNDILNLIDRTLTDTNVTQKIACLCGTVSRSDMLGHTRYSGFEDTMFQLIGHIAQCDQTKSYITSQLSLARSTNIDSALRIGPHVENHLINSSIQEFLKTGNIEEGGEEEKATTDNGGAKHPIEKRIEIFDN